MTPAPSVVKRAMGKVPLLVQANMNAQRMDTDVNFVTVTTTWRVFAAARITQSPLLLLLRTARAPFLMPYALLLTQDDPNWTSDHPP